MSFTVAEAITRLTGGSTSCFKAGISSAQQLNTINLVLDRFYEFGTWRGVHDTPTITSTSGVITLATTYQRLDGLGIPANNWIVPIKSQEWMFSVAGPRVQNWVNYCDLVAIDMGDNSSGQHQYQLSGETSVADGYSFTALARKRFTWITNTADKVIPDSFQGLRLGVLAMNREDEGALEEYKTQFAEALQVLNGNLREFEPEERQIVIQPSLAAGSFSPVH